MGEPRSGYAGLSREQLATLVPELASLTEPERQTLLALLRKIEESQPEPPAG